MEWDTLIFAGAIIFVFGIIAIIFYFQNRFLKRAGDKMRPMLEEVGRDLDEFHLEGEGIYDLRGAKDGRPVFVHYILGRRSSSPKTLWQIGHGARIPDPVLVRSRSVGWGQVPINMMRKQHIPDPIFTRYFHVHCHTDQGLTRILDNEVRFRLQNLLDERQGFMFLMIQNSKVKYYSRGWCEDPDYHRKVLKELLAISGHLDEKGPRSEISGV